MKTLAVAGLAGLLAIVALAAYGGMDTTASRDLSKRKTVADDAGNLHVPDTYRTTYELLGSWAVAADQARVHSSSTSSMHRPGPSPPIARTDVSPTVRCS